MAIKRRKARKPNLPAIDDGVIDIPEDVLPEDHSIRVNALTGGVEIDNDDGSITIDPTGSSLWEKPEDADDSFHANIAEQIDPVERGRIAEDLLMRIDTYKSGRSQWEGMRAKSIELLGLKLEDPKGDVSRSALGMSTSVVRDPTLLQAVEFFRANAYSELCPSAGPVKVVNFADDTSEETDQLAQALQTDMNYYLTTTASEYYPDMYYMLWWTGVASGTFKKVYKCPLRNRPVSEYVDGTKIICPTTATDLKNAPLVAHEVEMDKATLRAMQLSGVYRDIPLVEPLATPIGPVDAKKATLTGKDPSNQLPEDQPYTLYETYARLNIRGFEHKQGKKDTGLPLPYRITVDTTSREILELRRNWDEEDDEEIFRPAQIPLVLFPFSTGLDRIYGSGLGQMMGNMASALTALLRISIDGGILGNYPGFIKAKGAQRDVVNEIMVPPGGCVEVDTAGLPIQQSMMPVPYKDASPAVMQLMEQTRGVARQLGGTADIPTSEGSQNAPVGTTLAMLEQASKMISATHRMLHAAQSEEFRLLVKLLKDDPEAIWRQNKRPAFGAIAPRGDNETDEQYEARQEQAKQARVAKFMKALDNCDIQPMSDPNVPSEMHRKLLAMGLKQLTAPTVPGAPPIYNQVEVDRYIAHAVYKMSDAQFNKFLAPPMPAGPPPIDPMAIQQAKLQIDAHKAETQRMKATGDLQLGQKKIDSQEQVDAAKLGQAHAAAMANGGPVAPDPEQMAALHLKAQQIDQSGRKMILDAHNAHADRQSKETVKAMDIAARLATHPESQPVVNAELQGLSEFTTPAAEAAPPGAKDGGAVGSPMDEEIVKAMRLARIVEALQSGPTSGYMQ